MRCGIVRNYYSARMRSPDSFLFHQAHHRILKTKPFLLELFRVFRRRNAMRHAKDNPHCRKWTRQDETVPAPEAPAAGVFQVRGNHWGVAFLSEKNDTLAELISRSPRTIRRNDKMGSTCENFGEPQEGARTLA